MTPLLLSRKTVYQQLPNGLHVYDWDKRTSRPLLKGEFYFPMNQGDNFFSVTLFGSPDPARAKQGFAHGTSGPIGFTNVFFGQSGVDERPYSIIFDVRTGRLQWVSGLAGALPIGAGSSRGQEVSFHTLPAPLQARGN